MSTLAMLVTAGLLLGATASSLRRSTCPSEACSFAVDVKGASCELVSLGDGKECYCCDDDGLGRPGRTERATFGGRRRFGGCALHCRGGAVDTRNCRCIRRY
uniref:Putative salivary protein n=1 Tax=Ixodes scapularis TaxID=6945 RepID=Q4PMD9_IXOSC|nr:putative salivary protein [Ixodes scapularis]